MYVFIFINFFLARIRRERIDSLAIAIFFFFYIQVLIFISIVKIYDRAKNKTKQKKKNHSEHYSSESAAKRLMLVFFPLFSRGLFVVFFFNSCSLRAG